MIGIHSRSVPGAVCFRCGHRGTETEPVLLRLRHLEGGLRVGEEFYCQQIFACHDRECVAHRREGRTDA